VTVTAGRAFAVLTPLAVAACTSTGCDPSRAGFIESLGCESGGFQTRQVVLQNSLAQTQAGMLQQQARAAQAHSDAVTAQADLARRRERLANLDASFATLRLRLKQAEARQNVDQQALAQARAEVDTLALQRREVRSSDPDPQRLNVLSARESKVLELLQTME